MVTKLVGIVTACVFLTLSLLAPAIAASTKDQMEGHWEGIWSVQNGGSWLLGDLILNIERKDSKLISRLTILDAEEYSGSYTYETDAQDKPLPFTYTGLVAPGMPFTVTLQNRNTLVGTCGGFYGDVDLKFKRVVADSEKH